MSQHINTPSISEQAPYATNKGEEAAQMRSSRLRQLMRKDEKNQSKHLEALKQVKPLRRFRPIEQYKQEAPFFVHDPHVSMFNKSNNFQTLDSRQMAEEARESKKKAHYISVKEKVRDMRKVDK